MFCWKCNHTIPIKISFRTECPQCGAELHVCKNCRYYAPGKPNDCSVPATEPISDREASNFCEEFKPQTNPQLPASTDKAKRIFDLDEQSLIRRDFNSLFKDD